MKLNEISKINAIIQDEVSNVRKYFKGLDNSTINYAVLAKRIGDELPSRIERIKQVIETTVISLLKEDARMAISSWAVKDKNRYYDAKIEILIKKDIIVEPYSANSIKTLQYLLQGFIIFVAGMLLINASFLGIILKVLIFVLVAIGAGVGVPLMISLQQKKKIFLHFEKYMDDFENALTQQANVIASEYKIKFEELESSTI